MTKTQVEVITSVQRRRRWSRAEKERIVAAAIEPGASASEVARAEGIHSSQLFRWRQELCGPARATPPRFSAVTVVGGPEAGEGSSQPPPAAIEIEFVSGTRMWIVGATDAVALKAVITALAKIDRRR